MPAITVWVQPNSFLITFKFFAKIDIYLADSDGSSNPVYIVRDQMVTIGQTFVFNDKFSYTGGTQKLQIIAKSSANMDAICTYIDQDWS